MQKNPAGAAAALLGSLPHGLLTCRLLLALRPPRLPGPGRQPPPGSEGKATEPVFGEASSSSPLPPYALRQGWKVNVNTV